MTYFSSMVYGRRNTFFAGLNTGNIGATKGFMLVDLSDTVNWPHTNTGAIVIHGICIDIDPDGFTGSVKVGFLSNVDATDGDLTIFRQWDFTNKSQAINMTCHFEDFYMPVANIFAGTDLNDVTWQTDVNLFGPDGATAYPAGDGDMVIKITRTGGNIIAHIGVMYQTDA